MNNHCCFYQRCPKLIIISTCTAINWKEKLEYWSRYTGRKNYNVLQMINVKLLHLSIIHCTFYYVFLARSFPFVHSFVRSNVTNSIGVNLNKAALTCQKISKKQFSSNFYQNNIYCTFCKGYKSIMV